MNVMDKVMLGSTPSNYAYNFFTLYDLENMTIFLIYCFNI